MHGLAPPACVARAREPAAPVCDGLVEELERLRLSVMARLLVKPNLLDDERRVPGGEREA